MQRVRSSIFKVSCRRFAAEAKSSSTDLTLNFCTPNSSIYVHKAVKQVIVPSESGEMGITAGMSPVIAQLKPGVVTVMHTGGEVEKFFVAGGFSLVQGDSKADVSVTEAVPISEFDEAAVKSGYAEAVKLSASGSDEIAKATGMIQVQTYNTIAKAMGIVL